MALGSRELGFIFLAVLVGATCIRLGFWQLARLAERRARNAEITEQMAQPPVSLLEAVASEGHLAFRRAEGEGTWLTGDEVTIANRALGGMPGAHLVTPLRVAGSDRAILVDRGWIPQDSIEDGGRVAYPDAGTASVVGMLKPSQQEPALSFLGDPMPVPGGPPRDSWRVLSVQWIAQQIEVPIAALYLELTEAPQNGVQPTPDPDLDLSEGPHLGYALQWFAFSAIAFGGVVLWIRKRKRPAA